MFLQAIVIGDDAYEPEKASRSFSNKHIFPGGCLPSQALITRLGRRQRDARRPLRGDLRQLRAHPGDLARALQRRLAEPARRAATTTASAACGTSTSRSPRAAFASAGSATCRWCSPSPAGERRRTAMAIAYARTGSGEPLVLIHGLGGSRRIWEPVVDRLSAERDVIAVDLPGFGESAELPDGRRRRRRPTSAATVAALCAELGLERPHLAGNSLGGWVALELAKAGRRALGLRDLPGRPLAAAAGAAAGRHPRRGRCGCGRCCRWCWPRRGSAPPLLRTIVARPERLSRAEAKGAGLTTGSTPPATTRRTARCARTCSSTPSWSRSRRRSPGAPRTGSSAAPRPERMPPGARYVELEGVGHTPTWDDPPLIAELLLEASAATPRRPSSRSVPGAPRPARRRSPCRSSPGRSGR